MDTQTSPTGKVLASELAAVRAELVRVDGKCATLTGLAGAGIAFVLTATTAPRLDLPTRILLAAAALAWTAAAILLLTRVLRPQLGFTGFNLWATMTPGAIQDALTNRAEDDHNSVELWVLSGIAVRKYKALRRAVAYLGAGIVLVAVAILASAL